MKKALLFIAGFLCAFFLCAAYIVLAPTNYFRNGGVDAHFMRLSPTQCIGIVSTSGDAFAGDSLVSVSSSGEIWSTYLPQGWGRGIAVFRKAKTGELIFCDIDAKRSAILDVEAKKLTESSARILMEDGDDLILLNRDHGRSEKLKP